MVKRPPRRLRPSSLACVYCGQFTRRHLEGVGYVCGSCADLPERDPAYSREVTCEPARHTRP